MDGVSFRRLAGYVRERLPELAQSLRRHAVVHQGGDSVTVHAIVGLYAKVRPRFAVRTFDKMAEALRWLGRPTSMAAEELGDARHLRR